MTADHPKIRQQPLSLWKCLIGLLLLCLQVFFLLRTADVLNNRALLDAVFPRVGLYLALWALYALLFFLHLRLPVRPFMRPLPILALIGISLLNSLLFFGKGLLYTENGYWLSLSNLPFFLLLVPVIAVAGLQTMQLMRAWLPYVFQSTAPKWIPLHGLMLALLQSAPLVIYFVAFQPGNMSYDTYNQWSQILGHIPYTTWHPIAHTLTMQFFLWIWQDLTIIALAQLLFYVFVTTQFACVLMRQGARPWIFYPLLLLMAATPTMGINLMTLWKDIPFTIALLWATLILYKMLTREDYFSSPLQVMEFTLCMAIVGLYRYNGLLAFALVMLFALFYLRGKVGPIQIKGLLSIVAAGTLFFFVMGPLPGLLQADPNPAGMKLRPIFQGLGGMYKAEQEAHLPPDMRLRMEEFATPEEWQTYYDAYFSDVYIEGIPGIVQNFSTVSTSDAIRAYVETTFRQPDVILGDRFNLSLLSWSAVADPYGYNNRFTTQIEPAIIEEFGVVRPDNTLAQLINEKSLATAHNRTHPEWASQRQFIAEDAPSLAPKPVLDALLWRVGSYEALLGIVAVLALYGAHRAWWLYMPLVGNWLLVFLTMPAQDYRYVWFVFVLCPFLLLSVLNMIHKKVVRNE